MTSYLSLRHQKSVMHSMKFFHRSHDNNENVVMTWWCHGNDKWQIFSPFTTILTTVDLSHNNLTGKFCLLELACVQYVDISHNQFGVIALQPLSRWHFIYQNFLHVHLIDRAWNWTKFSYRLTTFIANNNQLRGSAVIQDLTQRNTLEVSSKLNLEFQNREMK